MLQPSRGLTQEQVAKRLGCNTEYYGRLERGNGLPSVEMLDALADVLDVSVDDLLGEAIKTYRPEDLIDALPPRERKLAKIIAAKDYEYIRLMLRVMDYRAQLEGQAVEDDEGLDADDDDDDDDDS